MKTLSQWSDGGDATEWAVRYTAPEAYAGLVSNVRTVRQIAEGMVSQEMRDSDRTGIRCELVQRTVSRGPWRPVAEGGVR